MLSFIHAGDVHLGNPFKGLSRQLPEKFQKEIQEASFIAFQGLIDLAVTEKVDFVLFSGDLLNGSGVSARVQATLMSGFRQLKEAGITAIVSFGNHDYQAFDSQPRFWPENVLVFDHAVQEKVLTSRSGERVAFTGFSYADRSERRQRLADFPSRNPNVDYEIGLYHGSVGKLGDDYAAFSVDEMLAKNYDYWALGHIHQRATLHEQPTIAYSGNLQGLNRTEVGAKGVLLVQSGSHGLVERFIDLAPVRFEALTLTNVADPLAVVDALLQSNYSLPTFLTLTIDGPLQPALRQAYDEGHLLEVIQQSLPKSSNVWPIELTVQEQKTVVDALSATHDFSTAIEAVIQEGVGAKKLSDDVPLVVREYLNQPEGQVALRKSLEQLFSERRSSDED